MLLKKAAALAVADVLIQTLVLVGNMPELAVARSADHSPELELMEMVVSA
jgi:hypothetical protein